jgi:hypothetical protein
MLQAVCEVTACELGNDLGAQAMLIRSVMVRNSTNAIELESNLDFPLVLLISGFSKFIESPIKVR